MALTSKQAFSLPSGELHTSYWGGFSDQGSDPVPWRQEPNHQQYIFPYGNNLCYLRIVM